MKKRRLLTLLMLGLFTTGCQYQSLLDFDGIKYAWSTEDDNVTLKYTGNTTGNFVEEENGASLVGLDSAIWDVQAKKNGSNNNVGFNKDGDIRLYYHANGSNTLSVSCIDASLYKIDYITIAFTGNSYSNVSVSDGTDKITATNGKYYIDNYQFVLGNANTSNAQVRISSIGIYYKTFVDDGKFSITYDVDPDVSNEGNPSSYSEGDEIELVDPVREGYIFNGWKLNGVLLENNTIPSSQTGNITLTADWIEHPWHQFEALETESSMKLKYTANEIVVDNPYYEKVTSVSQLYNDAKVLIVSEDVAMSTTQNSNNRGTASVAISDNKIQTLKADVQEITLNKVQVNNETCYELMPSENEYLTAASSSSNYLRTKETSDDNSKWKISINNGEATILAQGNYTRKSLRYNSNNNIFSCYSEDNNQSAVSLYVKKDTEFNYNVTSVGLRFRVKLEKTLYDSFETFVSNKKYTSYSFGFEAYKGTKDGQTNPAEVEAANKNIGETEVTFALVIDNIPEASWNQLLTVYPYVEVDGIKHYMQEDTKSVVSLANEYITEHSEDTIVKDNEGVLTYLSQL